MHQTEVFHMCLCSQSLLVTANWRRGGALDTGRPEKTERRSASLVASTFSMRMGMRSFEQNRVMGVFSLLFLALSHTAHMIGNHEDAIAVYLVHGSWAGYSFLRCMQVVL